MTGPTVPLLLAGALLTWPSASTIPVQRLGALHVGRAERKPARRFRIGVSGARVRSSSTAAGRPAWLLAWVAGLAVALLVGGSAGAVVGAGVLAGLARLLGRATAGARTATTALREGIPVACDLLAVCLTAGVPVAAALDATAEAVAGPLGRQLAGVAALLQLGAEPRRAWADTSPELTGLARVMIRAGESGSSVTPALAALSGESRSAVRVATEEAVHRAGVWVLAPLGLCFLPSFICLGVVPLVLGIAGDVFR